MYFDDAWSTRTVLYSTSPLELKLGPPYFSDYSATHWTLEGENSPASGSDPSPAAVAMSGGNRKRILTYVVHLKPTIGPKTRNATGMASMEL